MHTNTSTHSHAHALFFHPQQDTEQVEQQCWFVFRAMKGASVSLWFLFVCAVVERKAFCCHHSLWAQWLTSLFFCFFFASSFTCLELFTGSRTVCAFAPKSKLHLFRLDVAGRRGKKYELPHEHAEFPTRQREQFALSWPLRAGRCMSGLALGKWKDLCGKSNHSEAMTQWEKGLLSACDSFTHRIISKTAASES